MFAYYFFRAAALLLGFALLVCVPVGLFVYLITPYIGRIALYCGLAAGAGAFLYHARSIRLKVEELRLIGEQCRR
jgi:hypothetical protein